MANGPTQTRLTRHGGSLRSRLRFPNIQVLLWMNAVIPVTGSQWSASFLQPFSVLLRGAIKNSKRRKRLQHISQFSKGFLRQSIATITKLECLRAFLDYSTICLTARNISHGYALSGFLRSRATSGNKLKLFRRIEGLGAHTPTRNCVPIMGNAKQPSKGGD